MTWIVCVWVALTVNLRIQRMRMAVLVDFSNQRMWPYRIYETNLECLWCEYRAANYQHRFGTRCFCATYCQWKFFSLMKSLVLLTTANYGGIGIIDIPLCRHLISICNWQLNYIIRYFLFDLSFEKNVRRRKLRWNEFVCFFNVWLIGTKEFNCTKWNKASVSCLTNALKLLDVC